MAEMCAFSCQSQPRAAMKGGAAMVPNNVLLSRIYSRAKEGYMSDDTLWTNVRCHLWIANTSIGLFRLRQTVIRPASTDNATHCTPFTHTIRQSYNGQRRSGAPIYLFQMLASQVRFWVDHTRNQILACVRLYMLLQNWMRMTVLRHSVFLTCLPEIWEFTWCEEDCQVI